MDFKAMIEEQQKRMEEVQAKVAEAQAESEKAHELKVEDLKEKVGEFSAKVDEFTQEFKDDVEEGLKLAEDKAEVRDEKVAAAQAEAEKEHAEEVAEVKAEAQEIKEDRKEREAAAGNELKARILIIRDGAQKQADDLRAKLFEAKAEMDKTSAENMQAIQEGIDERKIERDKAAQEEYITNLVNYAKECDALAATLALEAEAALLEASYEAADYVKKYGEEQ